MKKIKILILLLMSLSLVACMGKDKNNNRLNRENEKFEEKNGIKFYKALSEDELIKDSEIGIINYGKIEVSSYNDYTNEEFEKLGVKLEGKRKVNNKFFYFLESKDGKMYETMLNLENLEGVLGVEAQARLYSTNNLDIEETIPFNIESGLNFSLVPNDPRLGEMNSVKITELDKAWEEFGLGPLTPYVGVLDTGLNYEHEDINFDNMVVGKSRWDKIDVDGGNTAYVPLGMNEEGNLIFTNMLDNKYKNQNGKLNWDVNSGHGTHVTGTMMAKGDNNLGVAGVNWQAKLIAYKVFADNPNGAADRPDGNVIYDSLKDLVDEVVKLRKEGKITQKTIPVNFSIGGNYANSYALEVINYGLENGVLLVVAAGNSGRYFDATFPSSFSGVLAVGAGSIYGDATGFSTALNNLSVIAPGNAILSTSDRGNDEYRNMSGTSMAAPFVTGLISYMLTFDETLSPAEIRATLEQTADTVDNAWQVNNNQEENWSNKKWSPKNGYGRVNVYKAIEAVRNNLDSIVVDYSSKPLRVKVTSNHKYYTDNQLSYPVFSNSEVYIYRLNDKEVEEFVIGGRTNEEGIVDFYMLKEGNYIIKTTYGNNVIAENISFGKDQEVEVILNTNSLVWNMEILPIESQGKNADVNKHFFYLLDENFNILLVTANNGNSFGQYQFTKEGKYYLLLGSFTNYTYENSGGNYGISIYAGNDKPNYIIPTLNQDGTVGEDTNSNIVSGLSPKTVNIPMGDVVFGSFDQDEYGNLDNWDFYEFDITANEKSN